MSIFNNLLPTVFKRRFFKQDRGYDKPWSLPFDNRASVEDIYHCFRLLLGRNPHREEWQGHSSRAGELLQDVVQTYLTSGEFKGRNLLASEMPENVVRKHNGRFEVFANAADPVIGAPVLSNTYEPNVTSVVEQILKPGDTFLDVGANLGYFSLLAASLVGDEGQVFAVEPNDLNIKLLESSLKANDFGNVNVMQLAAAERIETLLLHSTIGNGTTSALRERELFSGRTIPGLPLDVMLSGREKPVALMKIDVEGFEYRALRGAQNLLCDDRPEIIFEFSAGGIDGISGTGFLEWLADKGYEFSDISSNPNIHERHSVNEIMAAFDRAMVDHLDILACPINGNSNQPQRI